MRKPAWLLGKQRRAWLSSAGSRKNGRMSARGSRVAEAKEKNGVLHIVAPLNVSPVKLLKPPKR